MFYLVLWIHEGVINKKTVARKLLANKTRQLSPHHKFRQLEDATAEDRRPRRQNVSYPHSSSFRLQDTATTPSDVAMTIFAADSDNIDYNMRKGQEHHYVPLC